MKIYPDQRYDATVSLKVSTGYKLHSYLSNRTPAEVFTELAQEGLKEEDISVFWTPRYSKPIGA